MSSWLAYVVVVWAVVLVGCIFLGGCTSEQVQEHEGAYVAGAYAAGYLAVGQAHLDARTAERVAVAASALVVSLDGKEELSEADLATISEQLGAASAGVAGAVVAGIQAELAHLTGQGWGKVAAQIAAAACKGVRDAARLVKE